MNKHNHPRFTDRNGKTWVTKSISNFCKIECHGKVDPMTLPLRERPSFMRNVARYYGITNAEAFGRHGARPAAW